jgi:lambda family phage portal protein
MNALDKVIGYFSPERAYRRARFRAAAETFAYDGAKSGRRTDGWMAAGGDANTEVGASLINLRNRSRDLLRNNPYASKAIAELVGNTVGTGIVPQAKTGTPELDKIIDAEWLYFAENCDPGGQLDFYGMQALIVRTTAESGDGIVRFRPRLPQDNFRVPLQLQVLEGDFLDISRTMGIASGHIVQGVQFNLFGQREAYWLYNYHPGGVFMLNPRGGILSQPVPASQVMHTYCILRPGQVRGVPWLAPVMLAMRDLDDYRDAERMRKKTEACLAGIVTRPEGSGGLPLGAKSTDPKTGNTLERMYPGMIEYLKPGEDIKFNAPSPAGGYRNFIYRYYRCRSTAGGQRPCGRQISAPAIEGAVRQNLEMLWGVHLDEDQIRVHVESVVYNHRVRSVNATFIRPPEQEEDPDSKEVEVLLGKRKRRNARRWRRLQSAHSGEEFSTAFGGPNRWQLQSAQSPRQAQDRRSAGSHRMRRDAVQRWSVCSQHPEDPSIRRSCPRSPDDDDQPFHYVVELRFGDVTGAVEHPLVN